jgi:hypothetical protein
MLGEHDLWMHGHALYDETLRIPLLIRSPSGRGTTVNAPVSLVDIAPTVLDLAGIQPSALFNGRSLRPALEAHPLAEHAQFVAERADRGQRGRDRSGGASQRVAHRRQPLAVPDHRTGCKRAHVEGVHVEPDLELGVAREHHLEATVESVAIDDVGADAATDSVRRLEHYHVVAGLREPPSGRQSGEAGADDHHAGPPGRVACCDDVHTISLMRAPS